MNKPLFTGVCTALVTPFLDGKVNYPMAETLLRRQMEAGIQAAVIAGTTGEGATLSEQEKMELIRRCKAFAGNQCKIIAGTGSNSTVHAVQLSCEAESLGADALLVVSPYYNKANEDGLVAHYMAISHAVNIPVILYNVPTRTGVDIPVSVYKRLSSIPNIAGVKESSNDITKITKIRSQCPDSFAVWSGNDDMTVPAISLGALGVISVASNIIPAEIEAMVSAALAGDHRVAAQMQCKNQALIDLLFSDVNPIPVKEAMRIIGYDCGECRLPLTSMPQQKKAKLTAYFR